MQETLALCQHIIVPLHFVKAQYTDFGVPADHIFVIPPGMGTSIWEGSGPVPRPHGQGLRFGYIGSLLRHKGVDFMIQAFRQLNAPNTELWVHGFELPNTPFSKRLHDLADGDPRIHFTGGYAASDLPRILNQLDVLLIPPLWHETFSFVTREAILAGLPVIASRMGGIPEAIEDGVNGLLLPPGDMDAWVMAMRRVVSDPTLVTQFHRAQLTRHVKTMDEHASELIQFYAQIQASYGKRELM
jgi:glycosyltransferase involved in cell wall biosynthesis